MELSHAIRPQKQGGGEEKKPKTQGSSGKFYINHIESLKYKNVTFWGLKKSESWCGMSTWLSCHSFLVVGVSGKYGLGSMICLTISCKLPGTQFILGSFQFVSLFQFTFPF